MIALKVSIAIVSSLVLAEAARHSKGYHHGSSSSEEDVWIPPAHRGHDHHHHSGHEDSSSSSSSSSEEVHTDCLTVPPPRHFTWELYSDFEGKPLSSFGVNNDGTTFNNCFDKALMENKVQFYSNSVQRALDQLPDLHISDELREKTKAYLNHVLHGVNHFSGTVEATPVEIFRPHA